jgi:hypothetical protein
MKWIAVLLMTIDHFGLYFSGMIPIEIETLCRLLGRLAFPMFAYLISLGYRRTRSVPKYFLRLAFFAVAGQVLLEFTAARTGAFVFRNVLFTFALSLIALLGFDFATKSMSDMVATMRPVANAPTEGQPPPSYGVKVNVKGISLPTRTGFILGTGLLILSFTAVVLLDADYSYYGILTVLLFHLVNEHTEPLTPTLSVEHTYKFVFMALRLHLLLNLTYLIINVVFCGGHLAPYLMQCFSSFAVFLFPLECRAGKPRTVTKYFFYFYYPLHLAFIMWLSAIISVKCANILSLILL